MKDLDEKEDIKKCFIPEPDNPYPLCVGRNLEQCKDCQLRADYEPEFLYIEEMRWEGLI